MRPQPPHTRQKNMSKHMAPKLPNLPCFEAFRVIFCPGVCSYFCLVCGVRGFTSVFLHGKSRFMHQMWKSIDSPVAFRRNGCQFVLQIANGLAEVSLLQAPSATNRAKLMIKIVRRHLFSASYVCVQLQKVTPEEFWCVMVTSRKSPRWCSGAT